MSNKIQNPKEQKMTSANHDEKIRSMFEVEELEDRLEMKPWLGTNDLDHCCAFASETCDGGGTSA